MTYPREPNGASPGSCVLPRTPPPIHEPWPKRWPIAAAGRYALPSGQEVSDGAARLALRIVEPGDLRQAEQTIRRASYKDTDAKVARFNRRISLPISIALLPTPLTANQLSVMLVVLGFWAARLFAAGHYWSGVLAGFLSLAASVLDGCDGEIARLKYQESALGCWIETFGDYSYYIAIFIGLTIGAVRQTGSTGSTGSAASPCADCC